jgi:hypothetical protein
MKGDWGKKVTKDRKTGKPAVSRLTPEDVIALDDKDFGDF